MSKKIQSILSLIEIAENNLNNARNLLVQLVDEKGLNTNTDGVYKNVSADESQAMEVIEGFFDGENMIGDNGQIYTVPQNYASKTQLVIGDRMKWMLTPDREVFKLIGQAARERIIGQFSMENDNYVVVAEKFKNPIKILKASATFAMKNLGLNFGDEVVVIIPRGVTPTWGAFSSVVKTLSETEKSMILNAEKPEQSNEDNDGYFDLSSKINNSDYL